MIYLRISILAVAAVMLMSSFRSKKLSNAPYTIMVDKSDYELTLFDTEKWLVIYPVVFGNNDQGDKMIEGDRKTPEGSFTIISKRVHEKWDRMMMLNYPTQESYEKFNRRKASGVLPSNARIGGSIGIHGTWPKNDEVIDKTKNWTLGCVSMKNEDVEDLYSKVGVGTRVIIRQ
jgi:murein L,D-transpeptidase YafK